MSLWDDLWDIGAWMAPWNSWSSRPLLIFEEAWSEDTERLATIHADRRSASCWSGSPPTRPRS